ncbi:hypothetical protein [Bacillus sp. UNC438CL73TsuS30]|uniref:hypothetical protein n=1 Tax=Bacillus sp. UNC438CL73TsuS30 TaxID=1340434 RepID=UPI00047DDC7D|nr:hypothetical protein [Bacillus sp. UNC438CL73TsuS30]
MNTRKKNFFKYVTMFNEEDKKFFLEGAEIDEGIKEVVDAINEIDDFVTMNSCQGGGHAANDIIKFIVPSQPNEVKEFVKDLMKEYDENHCPNTYVDFYVLYHNYRLAEELFIFLKQKIGDNIECGLTFEEDGNINEETFKATGEIIYRYGIQAIYGYDIELLEDLAKSIREFKTLIVNHNE